MNQESINKLLKSMLKHSEEKDLQILISIVNSTEDENPNLELNLTEHFTAEVIGDSVLFTEVITEAETLVQKVGDELKDVPNPDAGKKNYYYYLVHLNQIVMIGSA